MYGPHTAEHKAFMQSCARAMPHEPKSLRLAMIYAVPVGCMTRGRARIAKTHAEAAYVLVNCCKNMKARYRPGPDTRTPARKQTTLTTCVGRPLSKAFQSKLDHVDEKIKYDICILPKTGKALGA